MDTSKALEILGLEGDPSPTAIKKAYREQVKLWHPDRYSAGSTMKTLAEKNIQDANLAYAFLRRRTAGLKPEPRPPASRPHRRPDRPQHLPFASRLRDGLHRLLSVLGNLVPDTFPGRLGNWLRNDPRNRFRPWYRYPDDSGRAEDRPNAMTFDRALQHALQNREALKRLHRAQRKSAAGDATDGVPPVDAVARTRKVSPGGSSEKE